MTGIFQFKKLLKKFHYRAKKKNYKLISCNILKSRVVTFEFSLFVDRMY